jgi:exopolysaccharide production protein ExoZ
LLQSNKINGIHFPGQVWEMHFRSIQLLRGLAALLVVFVHDAGAYDFFMALAGFKQPSALSFGNLRLFGASGVHLFFVISGFVIALQKNQIGLPGFVQFSINRIKRIMPPYWIATFIFVAITPGNTFNTWTNVTKSLLFVPIGDHYPVLNVGWTLNYEMYFYALFAFTVVLIGARSFTVIVAVMVLMVAGSWSDSPWANLTGSLIVLEFALGVVVHAIYRSSIVSRLSPLVLAVGALLFFSTAIWFKPAMRTGNENVLAWGLPSFLIVLGAVSWEYKARFPLRKTALTFIGDASYSIYLVHTLLFRGTWGVFPVLFLHLPILTLVHPLAAIAFMMALSTAVGCVFHVYIEKPSTRWAGKSLSFFAFPPVAEVSTLRLAETSEPAPKRERTVSGLD